MWYQSIIITLDFYLYCSVFLRAGESLLAIRHSKAEEQRWPDGRWRYWLQPEIKQQHSKLMKAVSSYKTQGILSALNNYFQLTCCCCCSLGVGWKKLHPSWNLVVKLPLELLVCLFLMEINSMACVAWLETIKNHFVAT